MKDEFKSLSVEDLRAKDKELRESLFRLRFQNSIRRLDNPAQLSSLKRNIARIQTYLTEKEQSHN